MRRAQRARRLACALAVAALAAAGCLDGQGPVPAGSATRATTHAAAGATGGAPDGPWPLRLARVIDSDSARPATPFEAFDAASLNVADLLGDGRLQVVSINDNLRTYVLDPATGALLAELTTLHTGEDAWMARDINGVAVGDVTGNGTADLAILNGSAYLTILEVVPERSTAEGIAFRRVWRQWANVRAFDPGFSQTHPWSTNASQGELGADGHPFIAHLPGEAGGTVLVQTDGLPGHFAFHPNGTLRWATSFWDGNAGPWAGRLRPAWPVRAVFATDSGAVVAYDAASGAIQWTFEARAHGADPGSISVTPHAVDLDGDGAMSVFVGARVAAEGPQPTDANATDWMRRSHARYFLLDADGRLAWQKSFPWGNPMLYMAPAAVEVDGDGVLDLVVLDWNTIGHRPGHWQKVGPANLFALSGATGEALWRVAVDASWSNKGVAVAGFLPGGAQVLVEDQRGSLDGFSLFSLQGEFLQWVPLQAGGWRLTRGPVLADVDGDGLVEVVAPAWRDAGACAPGDAGCARTQTPHCLRADVGCRMGAILVFDTDAPNGSVLWSGNHLYDSQAPAGLPVAEALQGPLS